MTTPSREALIQILGGYLHQDWRTEFDSDQAALRHAVKVEPPSEIRLALQEIENLLEQRLTDISLKNVLINEVDMSYDPEVEGISYSEWLRRAYQCLAERD